MNNSNLNINKSFDAEILTASNTPSIYENMKENINNSYNEDLTIIDAIFSTSDPVEKDNKLKEFLISLCKEKQKLKLEIAYLKYDSSFAEKKDLLEMEKRITANITKDIKDNTTSIQKIESRVTTLEQSPPPILNNSSSELAKAVPKVKIQKDDFKEKLRTVLTKQPMTMNAICDSLYKYYDIYIHRNSKDSFITIHTLRNYLYELQNSKFICIALTNKEKKPSRHNPLLI